MKARNPLNIHELAHETRSQWLGSRMPWTLLIGMFLLFIGSGCQKPNLGRYQRRITASSITRTDTVGGSYMFHGFAVPRNREWLIREDHYLGNTDFELRSPSGEMRESWLFDIHGNLIAYSTFDRDASPRTKILVLLGDNPGESVEEKSFIATRWHQGKIMHCMYVEKGKIVSLSWPRKLYNYYASGRRRMRLDYVDGEKVERARMYDESGKCVADTVLAVPRSVGAIRPNIDIILERMWKQ